MFCWPWDVMACMEARPLRARWAPDPAKPALRSGRTCPLLRSLQRPKATAQTRVASSRTPVRVTAQTVAARQRPHHRESRPVRRSGTIRVWPKQSTPRCRIARRAEVPGSRHSFAAQLRAKTASGRRSGSRTSGRWKAGTSLRGRPSRRKPRRACRPVCRQRSRW